MNRETKGRNLTYSRRQSFLTPLWLAEFEVYFGSSPRGAWNNREPLRDLIFSSPATLTGIRNGWPFFNRSSMTAFILREFEPTSSASTAVGWMSLLVAEVIFLSDIIEQRIVNDLNHPDQAD